MATKKTASSERAENIGASLSDFTINVTAAPLPDYAASALEELARAAGENAKAIAAIAGALKGADASLGTGIHLSNISSGQTAQ